MKLLRNFLASKVTILSCLFFGVPCSFVPLSAAGANPVLWDTSTRFADTVTIDDRAAWKTVPGDLFSLEANPPKASSDPGYYGREYVFKGDAVVESEHLLAVVWASKGRVVIYGKPQATDSGASTNSGSSALTRVLEILPLPTKSGPLTIGRVEIIRNGSDQIVLQVAFGDSPNVSAVIAFGDDEIVDVKPSAALTGIRVLAPLEYAIVPSFIGDDLIYSAANESRSNQMCLPSENMLVGLVKGEGSEFVMTWPKGKQRLTLGLADEEAGRHAIQSVDLENDGQSLYLAPLVASGIWHRESLTPAFLEADTRIDWKRPFPARWKTELYEESLKTSYAFRDAKGDIWRGVPGSYNYPVWFEGGQTFYSLSKKVPPKGESLVYFLEGQQTPASISTPADILRSTLGRPFADSILDVPGRKLRTHHRRGGDGVHRACTCGCTEAIQAVFEAGDQVPRKEEIKGDLEDMVYFVHRHVERINEYRRFADDLSKFLKATKDSAPDQAEYLDSLDQVIRRIPEEYAVQQENMKSFAYADELVGRTMALTEKKEPNSLQSYMELLKEWRAMGGAQDYVLAQCHTITRKLAQEAGYGCTQDPKAVSIAQEVRVRARACLRNPDGYEVWADY